MDEYEGFFIGGYGSGDCGGINGNGRGDGYDDVFCGDYSDGWGSGDGRSWEEATHLKWEK
jgi:hypothetical protein